MVPDFEKYLITNITLIKQRCRFFIPGDIDKRELLYSSVMEKIWNNRDIFYGTETDFKKWTTRIVRNTFIDSCRLDKKEGKVDIKYAYGVSNSFDLEKNTLDKDFIKHIITSIKNNFSEKHFIIFKMAIIDELNYKNIAKELVMSPVSIRVTIHTIRQFLINERNRTNSSANSGIRKL